MDIADFFNSSLGIDADQLSIWQIGVRGLLVYLGTILLIKVGDKRFMGQSTTIDLIVGIALGSVLANALTGSNSDFWHEAAACVFLVGYHWVFSSLSYHFKKMDGFLKGRPLVLVEDGKVNWDNMRKSALSMQDLEMAMHSNGKVRDVADVALARFERNGDTSVIVKEQDRAPRVVDIAVRDGVQVVRVEFGRDQ